MSEVVIATRNAGKLNEFEAYLTPIGFKVISLPEGIVLPPEDGESLDENAFIKAQHGRRVLGKSCIGDDSGLFVDFLDGAPGVVSARFAGDSATDEDNIAKLLRLLDGVEPSLRGAEFRCTLCYCHEGENGPTVFARGIIRGQITTHERGNAGFGYDPIFVPHGANGRSFAEMTQLEKSTMSHRGKALEALVSVLSDTD